MNISPSIYRTSVHFFEESLLPTLTAQQQRIMAVALIALSVLTACVALYCCCFRAKVEGITESEEIPAIREDAKVEYLKGMKKFSFEVLQQMLVGSQKENQVVSPLGVSLLLSMIRFGVSAKEEVEIDHLLHLSRDDDEVKVNAFEFIKKLKEIGFDLAGLVYLNPSFRLHRDYQALVSQYFQSKVESGNSADQVNSWVKKMTHGQIGEIVSQQDLADFVVVLANALHFKAKWSVPFEAENTYQDNFVLPVKTVYPEEMHKEDVVDLYPIQVDMMHKADQVDYFENDQCQAIRLNYRDKAGVSLMLILPKQENDFSFIDEGAFDEIVNGMGSELVRIALPKFKLEKEMDVKAMLTQMGMKELFNKPDFSNLIDYRHAKPANPEISKMTQKSVLKCDEEGVEASTVTVAVIVPKCMPPVPEKEINFNRPFLAALIAEDIPVLFGVVRDPSA